jgi:hypothetical protein
MGLTQEGEHRRAVGDVRRPGSFWWICAAIGSCLPVPIGFLFASLILTIGAGVAGVHKGGWTANAAEFARLFQIGTVFASPLFPLTATCLPFSYWFGLDANGARQDRAAFILTAFGCGILGSAIYAALVNLALSAFRVQIAAEPLVLGLYYIIFGGVIAPLLAWLIWPILTKIDRRLLRQ